MARNFAGGILAEIVNRPLLAAPLQARFYLGYLASRRGIDGVLIDGATGQEEQLSALSASSSRYGVSEFGRIVPAGWNSGIATIEVTGALAHRTRQIQPVSGMVGYDSLGIQLDAALANNAVKGILLDEHCFGGQAFGCFDFAMRVREARKHKPVWAIADEVAYSAAYAIASQADRVIVTPRGGVGSVGVVVMHADFSEALEKEGIKVTFIHAGAHKVDGNPYQPLPATVRDEIQREVDADYKIFTALVADGNGIPLADVVATEARCLNAGEALEIGFVDAIQTPDDAFNEFAEYLSSAKVTFTAGSTASTKETAMTARNSAANAPAPAEEQGNPPENGNQPDPNATAETPEQAAQAFAARNPAVASVLRTQGATAERARQEGLELLAEPGEEAMLAAMKKDGTTVEAAALKFAGSRKEKRAAALQDRTQDTPAPLASAPAVATTTDARVEHELSDDELKARFVTSEKLKGDFSAADDYVAFVRASAAGRVNLKSIRT